MELSSQEQKRLELLEEGLWRADYWSRTEQGWRLRFHQGTPIPS